MEVTYENTSTPRSARNSRAMPAAATRAAVSRALARSKMLRQSSVSVLSAPTRSAWPGRGVTSRLRSLGGPPNGAMRSSQFSQSRLRTISATGAPVVRPKRTPDTTCTTSCSIFCRPPRPYPDCRRARSVLIWDSDILRPAGTPSTMAVRQGPWLSPAVRYRIASSLSALSDDVRVVLYPKPREARGRALPRAVRNRRSRLRARQLPIAALTAGRSQPPRP